ncbi:MAG: outer membrane beta-barrel protein [Bacteroidia bacterium]|nr:outer membrane beta-barrel protein [Bacteroidia bacterium]
MRNPRYLVASCFLSLVLTCPAQVELGVYGAAVPLQSSNGNLAAQTGLGGGAAFRYRFLGQFRLGLNAAVYDYTPAAPAPTYRIYPLEALAEWAPKLGYAVEPYLNASLGYYQTQLETSAPEGGSATTQTRSDIGLGGGVGVYLPVAKGLFVDLSARYLYLPAEEGPQTLLPLHLGLVYRFE